MKVEIVFFDCDGVLLFGNPWDALEKAANITPEQGNQWWDDYYNKKLTFSQWMEEQSKFFKKAKIDRSFIEKIFGPRNDQINKEAQVLINYLKSKKIEMAIISSGAQDYVASVAAHFGIKYYRYNTIPIFDENNKLVRLDAFGDDPEVKEMQIKEICSLTGIDPRECIFVGDSTNDYKAFELTKHGVMYDNHPELAKYAWKKVSDLEDIIPIIEEENGRVV